MKTQNTPEDKAKFFALYWGQKTLSDGVETHNISSVFNLKHESFFLKLKPLSAISDEDAIEVAKRMYPKDNHNDKDCLEWGKEIAREIIQGQTDKDVIWFAGIIQVADFIRSKGYLIGWMDLTAEDILSYGWARL